MEVVKTKSVREKVKRVRGLIKMAGNQLFAVSFVKRSDGTKRDMVCRRHVTHPQYASEPTGKKFRREKSTNQIVMDTNKITYNRKGKMNGRGEWRTIPIENVTRMKVQGQIYKFIS